MYETSQKIIVYTYLKATSESVVEWDIYMRINNREKNNRAQQAISKAKHTLAAFRPTKRTAKLYSEKLNDRRRIGQQNERVNTQGTQSCRNARHFICLSFLLRQQTIVIDEFQFCLSWSAVCVPIVICSASDSRYASRNLWPFWFFVLRATVADIHIIIMH